MAKSKYAPALFEVIHSERGSKKEAGRLTPPRWWRSSRPAGGTQAEGREPPTEQGGTTGPGEAGVAPSGGIATAESRSSSPGSPAETAATGLPGSGIQAVSPAARRPVDVGGMEAPPLRPPWVQVRSGRLEISLNPVNAAVVAGVVLLAMLCSYQLGAKFGTSVPPASSASPAPETPNPGVLEPAADGTADSAEPSPGTPAVGAVVPTRVQRSSALHYVVIESFKPEDLEEARHAQRWLAEFGGLPATLERQKGGGRYLLVSVEGFEYTPEREKQWVERVQRLGQEYRRAFKGKREIRYDFRQPYVRKIVVSKPDDR